MKPRIHQEKEPPDVSPLSHQGERRSEGVTRIESSRRVAKARGLRRRETEAEQKLWTMLRNRQVDGVKFRRQEPLGRYVADFVSFEKALIIELDGGQHGEDEAVERDRRRTESLETRGFRVIRFWNSDIRTNLDGVIMRIREALAER